MATVLRNLGEWQTRQTYEEFDRVTYRGTIYVCKYPEPHKSAFANLPGSHEGLSKYWVPLADALEQLPEVETVPAFRERRLLRIWFPDETYYKGQNVFFQFEIWEAVEMAAQGESPEVAPHKWKSVQGNDDTTSEGGGEGSLSDTTSPPYPGYEFKFEEAALVWEVTHNFGCKRFYFEVYDEGGRQHFGWQREYMDGNTVRIYFNEPVAGRVQMWALQPQNKPLNDLGVVPVCQTVPIYEADVEVPSSDWLVAHTLNIRKLKCQVFDDQDRQQFAFLKTVVNNQLVRLQFTSEFAGHVRLIPMTA
jgi:hypothetical protein